jgi:hypothetical protein
MVRRFRTIESLSELSVLGLITETPYLAEPLDEYCPVSF